MNHPIKLIAMRTLVRAIPAFLTIGLGSQLVFYTIYLHLTHALLEGHFDPQLESFGFYCIFIFYFDFFLYIV